ncbi:MAG: hypothetical protein GWO07_12560 [Candidatus Dadabacteria bacterium]|nr:hypothetical protein [Candidatus Dadabacteria bacterium]NIS09568.1 hypothetical protein [Candidatus Dadabacteria bacterium]NIV43077.1 hypothetical protein [Candidatus Dadabacteria bacterium]NIX16042.1 hypothetical protein [Candidatus Dadabacteria bacterium]NIY22745.1 hypothetical protein [Candidatus Dadabacteria bacterium]
MAISTNNFEIVLPKSIKSELNFIEKGIVSHQIDGIIYYVFKDSRIESLDYMDIEKISLEFDPILRDEFPSVRMIIRFFENNTEIFNMDYYFSVESEQELIHLYDLSRSKHLNIIYYNDGTSVCSKYALNNDELETINKTIDEINR